MNNFNRCLGMVACVVAGAAGSAFAEVLLYEPFDYAAGESINGKSPGGGLTWLTFNDGGGNIVTNAGLSFADAGYGPGYAVSGLATVADGTNAGNGGAWGNYAFSSLDVPTPSMPATWYYSFLARNTSSDNSTWAAQWKIDGGFRPGGAYGAFVTGIYGGGPDPWTLESYNSSTTTFGSDSTGVSTPVGDTFFVVMKVSRDDGGNMTSRVAINPAFSAEPLLWDAELDYSNNFGALIVLLAPQGGHSMMFDELRIATTWEDALPVTAVPEPTAVGVAIVLGLGGIALARRRRAGRRGAFDDGERSGS